MKAMSNSNVFTASWWSHRAVLLELLEQFRDEHIHFTPTEKLMTLGDQVHHIVTSAQMFIDLVKTGVFTKPQSNPAYATIEDVKKIVQEYTATQKEDIKSLTDEQLTATLPTKNIFGMDLTGTAILHLLIQHEIHHKGQLFAYARMVDVEHLPFFIHK